MVIFLVIMIKGLIIVYSILHSKARAVLRGGRCWWNFQTESMKNTMNSPEKMKARLFKSSKKIGLES